MEQFDFSQPPPPPRPAPRRGMPRVALVLLIVGALMLVAGGATFCYVSYRMNQEMDRMMRDLGNPKGPTPGE